MQLSAFLDVALTLISAYILLSLLCTTLNEFINMLLKTRANTLEQTVTALLDDPKIRAEFRKNGLITSMQSGASGGQNGALPSYLDGRTFAHALFGAIKPGQPIEGFQDLKGIVGDLPESQAKAAMTAALVTAEGDIVKARDGIAAWFDEAMNRLSGVYVRQMKYLSLAVGFAVALLLNVDTFELGKAAWHDRADLTAIEKLAQNPPASCETDADVARCQTAKMKTLVEGLRALPVGWLSFGPEPVVVKLPDGKSTVADLTGATASPKEVVSNQPSTWDVFLSWLWWGVRKLGGLACTALAISLGAPFWFDVLKLVTNVRGAGKKPEPEPVK